MTKTYDQELRLDAEIISQEDQRMNRIHTMTSCSLTL